MGAAVSPGLVCHAESILNFTYDVESATRALYTDSDRIIITVLMSAILAVGLLVNSAFLLVVFLVHHMRTTTNNYLVQIALADMLYLLSGPVAKMVRFAASPVAFDMRPTRAAGCTLIPLFISVSYYAILFLTTLVTREKFLAICKPLTYRAVNGRRRTVTMTLAAWGLAILVSSSLIPTTCVFVPYCIVWPAEWAQRDLPVVAATCNAVSEWLVSYHDVVQTAPFFLMMFLTLSMHACIFRGLRVQVAARPEHEGPITNRKLQTRRQVMRMLGISGMVFFCFFAPFECCSLAASLRAYVPHPLLDYYQFRLTVQIARTLAYLQAAVNPIIYCMLHPRYRRAFVETFSRRAKGPRPDQSATPGESQLSRSRCMMEYEASPRS